MEIWEPKIPGNLWDTSGLLRDSFTFTFYKYLFREHQPICSEGQEKNLSEMTSVIERTAF